MDNLKFRYPWRDYQQRVLGELEGHFDDDHLHIVAAPGSGKTILGLEVMRRMNVPTLILAPSIAIRNQWVERISMFLPEGTPSPDWISKDIKKPKKLTVTTYQALHATFSGEKEAEDIGEDEVESEEILKEIKKKKTLDVRAILKKQGIKAIVLDEAHHLRKEWWKALTQLKKELKNVQMVALTATPPYDVEYTEWQKYQELCGPIDAEIPIPELVFAGNLCPHQDYIHFSLPQGKEAEKLRQYKMDIARFLEEIKLNENFLNLFVTHSWINDTENYAEQILEEPNFFSAMIIFMHAAGITTPKYALDILGVSQAKIPALNVKWLEILFTGILYTHVESFEQHKIILDEMRKELKRIGAIERKKVIIDNTKDIQKTLAQSLGKLDSIVEIAKLESENLGDKLRMVILADYIRKEEIPTAVGKEEPIKKIGVIPIFEYLRRAYLKDVKLGVLTGSLIIIPKEAKDVLISVAGENGVAQENIRFHKLLHDKKFLRVDIAGQNRQKMVHLITEVFNQGAITALVGTQALLGEGWDAPSINTLILASYVGSYMLSNQMRGRAIRIDPKHPDKTSNIWHLVALDIETMEEKLRTMVTGQSKRQTVFDPFDEIKEDLGHDIKGMRRRFRAFEGVSFTAPPVIENGFQRMGLAKAKWSEAGVKKTNNKMLQHALERDKLPELWQGALLGKNAKPEMREKIKTNNAPQGFVFIDTLKYMVMNALIAGAAWGAQMLRGLEVAKSFQEMLPILMVGLGICFFIAVPKLLKALWLLFRNGSIEKSLRQVGHCVFETLSHMDIIKTSSQKVKIRITKDNMGAVYLRLDGASNVEKRYFFEALEDVLRPVENPRYLITRSSSLGGLSRIDYHAVPKIMGQHKKNAEFFSRCWNKYIGGSTLVYTRSKKGRRALLKARTGALSSAFRKKTDRISVWE